MKILFITHYDNMYGANMALYKLIKGLRLEGGHEVMLVIPARGQMTEALEEIGVKCIISSVTQWQAVYAGGFRFFIKKLIRRRKIRRELNYLYGLLRNEHIDLIHSNSSVIGTGAMLSKRLKCRHVWHIREFSKEHFGMRYFYGMNYVKGLYESASALITISDSLCNNYKAKYNGANILRVYDGVDGEDSWTNGMLADGKIHFGIVGYLFDKKHQMDVIEASSKLVAMGITNFMVHIIGDGFITYKQKLMDAIDDHNMQAYVEMKGYIPNVHETLNDMNVGILASEYEGFGLVTLEYMLHGMPVIGRNSGATPELIEATKAGLLFDDVDALAKAMKQLINDRELCIELGRRGRENAAHLFSEKENTANILDIYKTII